VCLQRSPLYVIVLKKKLPECGAAHYVCCGCDGFSFTLLGLQDRNKKEYGQNIKGNL
jgi:hypothetical protein